MWCEFYIFSKKFGVFLYKSFYTVAFRQCTSRLPTCLQLSNLKKRFTTLFCLMCVFNSCSIVSVFFCYYDKNIISYFIIIDKSIPWCEFNTKNSIMNCYFTNVNFFAYSGNVATIYAKLIYLLFWTVKISWSYLYLVKSLIYYLFKKCCTNPC